MTGKLEAARAAGSAAGDDLAKGADDCPYTFGSRTAERLIWFSGFSRARRFRRKGAAG
jgi:hypothetical protein